MTGGTLAVAYFGSERIAILSDPNKVHYFYTEKTSTLAVHPSIIRITEKKMTDTTCVCMFMIIYDVVRIAKLRALICTVAA